MQVDPVIYSDPAAQAREQRFKVLEYKWLVGIISIAASLTWMIIRTHISREPELPNRPFTRADVPLLKEKVKFLISDADALKTHDEAYHHFMSQANTLSRQITALENGTDPAQAAIPNAARRYGVAVGDAVDISAATPPIALHRASLTAMDDDQLTVRDGSDNFNVRWENIIHLSKTHGK